jgi:hypothetical protein
MSNRLPSAFPLACSPSDHAIRDTTPVHRLPALLRILDVLGEPLKEDLGRDSLPAAGMVMGVVTEVPKAVHKPALDVRHRRILSRRLPDRSSAACSIDGTAGF